MSNHSRDYDKTLALLKSVAAPCETKGGADHSWRKCRHCLALQELDYEDTRKRLAAFILAVETADENYGKVSAPDTPSETT